MKISSRGLNIISWLLISMHVLIACVFIYLTLSKPVINHCEMVYESGFCNSNFAFNLDSRIDLKNMLKYITIPDHRTKLGTKRIRVFGCLIDYLFIKLGAHTGLNPFRTMNLFLACLSSIPLFFIFKSITNSNRVSFISALFFLTLDGSLVNIIYPYHPHMPVVIIFFLSIVSLLLYLKRDRPKKIIAWGFIWAFLFLASITREEGIVLLLIFPVIAFIFSISMFKDIRNWFVYYNLLLAFLFLLSYLSGMRYHLGFWESMGPVSFKEQLSELSSRYDTDSLGILRSAPFLWLLRYLNFIFPFLKLSALLQKAGLVWLISFFIFFFIVLFSIACLKDRQTKSREWRKGPSIILSIFLFMPASLAITYSHIPDEIKRPFIEGIARYDIQWGFYYCCFVPVFTWIFVFISMFSIIHTRSPSIHIQALFIAAILGLKLMQSAIVFPLIGKEPRPRYDFQDLSAVKRVKTVIRDKRFVHPIYLSYPQVHNYGFAVYGQKISDSTKNIIRTYAVFEKNSPFLYYSYILPSYLLKYFENQTVISQTGLFERLKNEDIKSPGTFYDVRQRFIIPLEKWKSLMDSENILSLSESRLDESVFAEREYIFSAGESTMAWKVKKQKIKSPNLYMGAFIRTQEPDSLSLKVMLGDKVLGERRQIYVDSFEFICLRVDIGSDIEGNDISLNVVADEKNKGYSIAFPFAIEIPRDNVIIKYPSEK